MSLWDKMRTGASRAAELTQPALQSLSQEIATLETQIVDLQAQVAAVKGSIIPSDTAAKQTPQTPE